MTDSKEITDKRKDEMPELRSCSAMVTTMRDNPYPCNFPAKRLINGKYLCGTHSRTIKKLCAESPPVPDDVAEAVKDYVHTSKLKEAFGMFLNGMAYYETFPDDAEDAKQLRKQATYNFLRARNHISEEIADLCSMACKAVYTNEYEKGKVK